MSLFRTGAERRGSFPGGSVVKNLPAKVGDARFDPWVKKIPEEGNGNPLQYSCLGNPWTEEAGGPQFMKWQESQTQLSN